MKGGWDAEMAAAWARFVERCRRTRAPAALRERVLAALAADGGGAARQRGGPGPDRPGGDERVSRPPKGWAARRRR